METGLFSDGRRRGLFAEGRDEKSILWSGCAACLPLPLGIRSGFESKAATPWWLYDPGSCLRVLDLSFLSCNIGLVTSSSEGVGEN